jgi:KDO2-lipid IV(A) lauroyltransferase
MKVFSCDFQVFFLEKNDTLGMAAVLWIEYVVVRAFLSALAAIPYPESLRIIRFLARFLCTGSRILKRRIRNNLRIAFGNELAPDKVEDVVRGAFETLGRHAVEFSQMIRRRERGFTVENPEILREAHRKGKGVVLVSAHLGCFAKLVLVPPLLGLPASVIMKKQRNRLLQQWVVGLMKRHFGVDVLLKKTAADHVGSELVQGRVVGFFADQRPRGGGVPASFFGQHVDVPSGPAVCAKRYGSPLVVITLRSGAKGAHVARCEGPLTSEGTLEEISQRWVDVVERRIREHPEEWMWMHRRWRPDSQACPAKN